MIYSKLQIPNSKQTHLKFQCYHFSAIPAKAGIQEFLFCDLKSPLESRLRGNDKTFRSMLEKILRFNHGGIPKSNIE